MPGFLYAAFYSFVVSFLFVFFLFLIHSSNEHLVGSCYIPNSMAEGGGTTRKPRIPGFQDLVL